MSIHQDIDDTLTDKGLKLSVVIHEDELDGGFIAECLEIPGCMSQGETEEEANRNLIDALKACITVMIEDHLQKHAVPRAHNHNDKCEVFTFTPNVAAACVG